eukprot:SAG31_NODE_326_length_17664_cov_10.038543_16_plen_95_part_00
MLTGLEGSCSCIALLVGLDQVLGHSLLRSCGAELFQCCQLHVLSCSERRSDEYPTSWLLNNVIWPYESGEVIVQHYNALLTLSSVTQVYSGQCT